MVKKNPSNNSHFPRLLMMYKDDISPNLIKENKSITLNSLNEDQKTTLMSLSGVKDFPMRVKCATMAWHTLSSVLEKK